MKLLQLSLKSFRQHRDTQIAFEAGLCGIIGANGAGKTTLLEAISFALFGSKAVRGKIEDLVTFGAKRDQKLSVHLNFELEGVIYKIDRTLDDAKLYLGGEATPFAQGNRDVTSRVTALLRMNYEEFSSTFLTEQKGLEFLSGKKGATEREKFIVRMLGYDRLERMQEQLRSDRRDKRNNLLGLEAGLGNKESIEQKILDESEVFKAIEAQHLEAERVLKSAEKEALEARTIFERLQKRHGEYSQKKEELIRATQRKQELQNRIKTIEEHDTQNVLQEELLREITSNLMRLYPKGQLAVNSDLKNIREVLETAFRSFEVEIPSLEKQLSSQREKFQGQIATIQAHINMSLQEQKALQKKSRSLKSLEGNSDCPTCGQQLGDSFSVVHQKHLSEETQLEEKLSELNLALQKIQIEPDEIKELKNRLELLRKNNVEAQQLARSLQKFEQSHTLQLHLKKEHEMLVKELGQLEQSRLSLEEFIKNLGFSEEDYTKAKSHNQACDSLLDLARLQRVKLEGELNTKLALLERSKQELKTFLEKSHLLENERKELAIFEEGDRLLSEFRRYLNTQIRPRLAELASEFITELTDGRYSNIEIGTDFSPSVLEDGVPKAVISGGEEDLLNLCMRLALSQMLADRAGQSFSLLILDEVFGSLDEHRRNNVLTLLDRLGGRFEQILVITHLEDIREGVQYLLTVDYDEASGETKVIDQFKQEDAGLVFNL